MVSTWLVVLIVVVALSFDYTNGFHDAANAIATAVSVRALTPRVALLLAAVFNFVGAYTSQGVANTVKDIVGQQAGNKGLVLVLAALLGAITWNLITWWFGLPSSSSHALIGALIGAGLASGGAVHWDKVKEKVLLPMILSPLGGFLLAFALMVVVMWLVHRFHPRPLNRVFKALTALSSCTMAYGHGLQDAQKTMGVIMLALIAGGHAQPGTKDIPLWVIVSAATAISLGTFSGGMRIMRTLGRKVVKMDPARAFVAQTVASSVLMATAYGFKAPISTTHVISTSVMGVGATKKLSAVKWGMARTIITAWVLTIPCAALVSAAAYYPLRALLV